MWQNDVRLEDQSQGSDKESGRENNAKTPQKPLNELFNYLNDQTAKI